MRSDAAAQGSGPGAGLVGAALLAVVVLAIALRLAGLGFLLPHLPEPDGHIVRQVELLDGALPDPGADLNWGKYPHGIAHVARLLPAGEGVEPADLRQHLARAAAPFRRVRTAVAWLSVLAVPAAFLLARRFLGPWGSLLVAFWTATSLMHVAFSQQARPHAPAMAWILLSVAAAVELRRRPDAPRFAFAGIACAGTLACLQSGLATFLPLGWAVLTRERRPGEPDRPWLAVLPAAAAAASLVAFWPFVFGGSGGGKDAQQLELDSLQIRQAGHVIEFGWFTDGGFERTLHSFWSYEPLALALGALGVALWIASRARARPRAEGEPHEDVARRKDFWVVLAFVVPYVLVAAAYTRTYGRLVLPLLPFLYLAAASALARVWCACARLPGGSGARRAARLALAVAAVAYPGYAAWRHAAVRTRPDTATEAATWMAAHLDPAEVVVARPRTVDVPLVTSAAVREANRGFLRTDIASWLGYQLDHPAVDDVAAGWRLPYLPLDRARRVRRALEDPAGFVARLDATHVLLEDYLERRRDPVLGALYAEVRRRGQLVASWSPYAAGVAERLPLTYQDAPIWRQPHYARRVLQARTTGPVLELWRLPRDGDD